LKREGEVPQKEGNFLVILEEHQVDVVSKNVVGAILPSPQGTGRAGRKKGFSDI
jgi:hypothetical protein